MKTSRTAKPRKGEYATFTEALQKVLKVPYLELQKRLSAEKRAKRKTKRTIVP